MSSSARGTHKSASSIATTTPIVVVDYCKGNLQSVVRGLQAVGANATISDDPEVISAAPAIVLPGVGAFADAMTYMKQSGQAEAVQRSVKEGTPFLGICLGLQLMFDEGNEGVPDGRYMKGLGLVPGRCEVLCGQTAKVPHVGWNTVEFSAQAAGDPLLEDIPDGSYFYFTHSYIADPASASCVLATTEDGAASFASCVRSTDAYGVQFHPEKSSNTGLVLMKNFAKLVYERGVA